MINAKSKSFSSNSITENSFGKSRWVMPFADTNGVDRIMRDFDLPEIVARLLVQRGVAYDEVNTFLYPTLKDHFPDPFSMAGMREMAKYVAQAIIDKQRFAIFGDFDVDGATSSAVFYRFLKACGIETEIYIPDRLTEGYGPNIEALKTLKQNGADIVLMLDCGITSVDIVQQGNDLGLDILIFDHHEPAQTLPPAAHIINPKRNDDESGLDMLAAAGVVFLSCVAINSVLREQGFWSEQRPEPSLKDMLDIVALGTVCDMVPLKGVNRLFVKYGFADMHGSSNAGLGALIKACGIDETVKPSHAGYRLGPCINAGSRVHKSNLGARLLSTDDIEEATQIAFTLLDCNEKRKNLQADMERQAMAKVEAQGLDQYPVIIVDGEGWHTGLSGLVAGKLKEKYKKPACVIAYVKLGDGGLEGRGSGRSVPGVHIAQGFMDAVEEGLLLKGGGHAMAGGFTITPDKREDFKAFMYEQVKTQMENSDHRGETIIDSMITVRGCRYDLVERIEQILGPFGQDHPEPIFALSNVRVHTADIVGTNHLRLMVSDWEGGTRMKVMAFGALDTHMGQAFLKHQNRSFNIAGRLKLDTWNGNRRVEMHVQDASFFGD